MGDMALFCWLLCVWELYRFARWLLVTTWRALVLAFRGAVWAARKARASRKPR